MQDFLDELKAIVIEYGIDATNLCINLAVEKFSDIRNYPSDYTDEQIVADMQKNKSKIAMAVVELDSKEGMENQTAHSENGFGRTFKDGLIAYESVVPIMETI